MKYFTPLLFLLLLGGAAMPVSAQDSWSLERCITYAMENNLTVQRSVLGAEMNEASVKRAKGQLLPNLNGSASNVYNFGQRIDPFTNQFASSTVRSNNFSLSSSVTLFDGLQNVNTVKQSQLDLKASQYDVDKTRNDISLQIAQLYLQVLFAEELLAVAQSQRDISRLQVDRLQKLVDAGSLPRGDLYNVEAQLALEDANLITAENNVKLAFLALNQAMQLSADQEIKIVRPVINLPEIVSVEGRPGQIYGVAETVLPDIKSAETRLQSAATGLSIAKGARSPRLTLSASYGTGYSGAAQEVTSVTPDGTQVIGFTQNTAEAVLTETFNTTTRTKAFGDQFNDNLNRSIGLNLSIPIFNGFATQTSVNQAKLSMAMAEKDLEIVKNQIRQDIENAYAEAVAAGKSYQASRKSVESLSESFKYAQQRFDVGMMNAVDYNTAKNNLTRSESELVRGKYDFVFKTKVLDFYQGRPITLN